MKNSFSEEEKDPNQLKRRYWDRSILNYVEVDVFPKTFAEHITFSDGELLQDKLNSGALSGTFSVAKTYPSIAEMNADFTGTDVKTGELVIIACNEDDPDNAKLYVKAIDNYSFVVDLSGSRGIVGPKGDNGEIGPQGPQGLKGDNGERGEIGPQGPQGLKGDKGDNGEVGPQGLKGDNGEIGPQGPKGDSGDKGDIGITPSITHLEEQVDTAVNSVNALVGTVAPNQQDIEDIMGMIGGL